MPIKGLTTNREAAFPRIGFLRKGGVKTDPKRPGVDLTYFRFDSQDAQAVADFEQAYGKEPTAINIYLPFVTPDENFQAWQEEYRAGGLVHRCDGETMTIHLLPSGKYSTEPKPCPYHAGTAQRTTKEPGCKATGRLTVIIPELRRFAYVTSLTNSKNDIMELTDNLNAVYAMRGTLQGIPFRLIRRPRMISTPTPDGGRARREKWMLSLEVNPDWASMQLASMQKQAMLPAGAKMLTDGRTVTQDGEIDGDDGDGYWETEDAAPVVDVPPLNELEPLDYNAGHEAHSVDDDNPFTDPQPAAPVQPAAAMPKNAPRFTAPPEAHRWAVAEGYCANEFEARNSFKKIVDSHFGGKLNPADVPAACDMFVARQLEKGRTEQPA